MAIDRDDADRVRFLETVEEAVMRFGVRRPQCPDNRHQSACSTSWLSSTQEGGFAESDPFFVFFGKERRVNDLASVS